MCVIKTSGKVLAFKPKTVTVNLTDADVLDLRDHSMSDVEIDTQIDLLLSQSEETLCRYDVWKQSIAEIEQNKPKTNVIPFRSIAELDFSDDEIACLV